MLAAAAASALAFTLYVRVEHPWDALGWIAFVPWLARLDAARSTAAAAVAGLVMCVAFVLGVFGWFAAAIGTYTGAPWPLAGLVLVALAPVIQPQILALAIVHHLVRRRGAGAARTALTAASAYVGVEWAIPKLFGDTIGHGFLASERLRQAADLFGAPGLTFLLVLGNECALAAWRGARRRDLRAALLPLGVVAAVLLALAAYGTVRLRQLAPASHPASTVTAGIVQADIGAYDRLRAERGAYDAVRTILDAHFALSADALGRARLDLLVWPETVYPTTFGAPKSDAGADFDREIAGLVARTRVPLVFGAYDAEGEDEFNAAVFLAPARDGAASFETYRKAMLFPLTERVPAALESGLVRRWLPWLGTWKPGGGAEVFSVTLPDGRSVRIAPLICYDAVVPRLALDAVRRGAEVIVTLSNDSWFADGAGPHLHLVVSAFRSIETRRPQLRATNTGISAVVDATGRLTTVAGVHERTALVAEVTPVRGTWTLMLAWGDWFGPAAFAAALVLLAAGLGSR